MRPKRFINILTVEQIDRQFKTLRGREDEEAERYDFKHEKLLRHRDVLVAGVSVLQAALAGSEAVDILGCKGKQKCCLAKDKY
ncbi:hypothetical protein L1987_58239 [Smallanthus sonchifolius]|uniref:Uncharacterized protein n=1 Tax=Smallanthus sonchifolius TaxID=185202 RepID=A0ACB9DFU2_9ASTR|nr:hypothetical protein L1987_58239 [Smallanthus sonchifolius]